MPIDPVTGLERPESQRGGIFSRVLQQARQRALGSQLNPTPAGQSAAPPYQAPSGPADGPEVPRGGLDDDVVRPPGGPGFGPRSPFSGGGPTFPSGPGAAPPFQPPSAPPQPPPLEGLGDVQPTGGLDMPKVDTGPRLPPLDYIQSQFGKLPPTSASLDQIIQGLKDQGVDVRRATRAHGIPSGDKIIVNGVTMDLIRNEGAPGAVDTPGGSSWQLDLLDPNARPQQEAGGGLPSLLGQFGRSNLFDQAMEQLGQQSQGDMPPAPPDQGASAFMGDQMPDRRQLRRQMLRQQLGGM